MLEKSIALLGGLCLSLSIVSMCDKPKPEAAGMLLFLACSGAALFIVGITLSLIKPTNHPETRMPAKNPNYKIEAK